METITLKNGTEAFKPMVAVTMLSLRSLLKQNPIAFYELVMKCRDQSHRLFGNTGDVLGQLNLLDAGCHVDESIRNIVLSAVEGDVPDMKFGSPVAPTKKDETVHKAESKTARLDDFDLYCTVRRIGDQIQEIAKKHGCWFDDRRTEGANPYYNQSANGLFVEHYYGSVNKLWTPWGYWGFVGSSSGNWDEVWKEVAELLGATLHTPKEVNTMGEFGPVFAITKFGDKKLPKPEELDRSKYDSYEDVKTAWEDLTARYQSQNNG